LQAGPQQLKQGGPVGEVDGDLLFMVEQRFVAVNHQGHAVQHELWQGVL
jgi:hypothetical protein